MECAEALNELPPNVYETEIKTKLLRPNYSLLCKKCNPNYKPDFNH